MNRPELTKSKKKIARQVIDKGLQKEYIEGIIKLDNIITRWKTNSPGNRDTWLELYDSLTRHDRHISRRYDYMGGSKYLIVLAEQLADDVISPADLQELGEDVKSKILILAGMKDD
jgi:hypothetical protein